MLCYLSMSLVTSIDDDDDNVVIMMTLTMMMIVIYIFRYPYQYPPLPISIYIFSSYIILRYFTSVVVTLPLSKTSRIIIIVHTASFYHYLHTYILIIILYISTCDINHLRLSLSLTNKPLHLMDHRLWTID